MKTLFSSTAPLVNCEFPQLKRSIGVTVSMPYTHHGMQQTCVEISIERLALNTQTFAGQFVIGQSFDEATGSLQDEINRLAQEIVELEAHKIRMQADLDLLSSMKKAGSNLLPDEALALWLEILLRRKAKGWIELPEAFEVEADPFEPIFLVTFEDGVMHDLWEVANGEWAFGHWGRPVANSAETGALVTGDLDAVLTAILGQYKADQMQPAEPEDAFLDAEFEDRITGGLDFDLG